MTPLPTLLGPAAGHLPAAGACLALCGALGWFVPQLIARLPEPVPQSVPQSVSEPVSEPTVPSGSTNGSAVDASASTRRQLPPPPPKELYADIAARPGLDLWAAVASAICGALVGLATGWAWSLLFLVPLVPIGVALAVVDWRTTLLPTRIIAPTYAVAVVLVLVAGVLDGDRDAVVRAALGWAALGGVFLLLWVVYPAGMGYGDVRLSGVLGIVLGYLGWAQLVTGAYAGFLIGGVGGAVLAALRLVRRKRFPFGPFMLLGALVGVVCGPALVAGLGY